MLEDDEKDYLRRILARYGDVQPLDSSVSEPAGSGRLPEVAPAPAEVATEPVAAPSRPDIAPGGSFNDWRNRTFEPVPSGGSFEEQRARGNAIPDVPEPEIDAPAPDATTPPRPDILPSILTDPITEKEREVAELTRDDNYSTSKRTIWHKIGAALDGWARGGIFGGIAAVQDPHYFQNQKRQRELARLLPEIKAMQTARLGDAGYDAKVATTTNVRDLPGSRAAVRGRQEAKDAFEKTHKELLATLSAEKQRDLRAQNDRIYDLRKADQVQEADIAQKRLDQQLKLADINNAAAQKRADTMAGTSIRNTDARIAATAEQNRLSREQAVSLFNQKSAADKTKYLAGLKLKIDGTKDAGARKRMQEAYDILANQ